MRLTQRSIIALVTVGVAIAIIVYGISSSPHHESATVAEPGEDGTRPSLFSVGSTVADPEQTVDVDPQCEQADPEERSLSDANAEFESLAKKANVLRHSSSANHLIAAALISGWNKPRLQFELLEKAALADSRNPLVPWESTRLVSAR